MKLNSRLRKNKRLKRLNRAQASRAKMQGVTRLCVYRTPRHIYAQVIAPYSTQILASASTVERDIKNQLESTGNVEAAKLIGKLIAERALHAGVNKVSFDRSGFIYGGRVQALATAAREGGLQF